MAAFARWTNLSETTFLLPPTDAGADYRVRIFTPGGELPFAGHPTLGSCHAWLAAGGRPRQDGVVVQQCGVGLVRCGATARGWPSPRRRCAAAGRWTRRCSQQIREALGLAQAALRAHQWVDNGPGWCAVMLDSADARAGAAARLAAPGRAEARRGRAASGGRRGAVRGARLHRRRRLRRPGHRQPERQRGAVADRRRPGAAALRGRAGRGAAARRARARQREGDTVWVGGDVSACIHGEVDL